MAKNILFSADMVRAVLAGKKTETRREIKPQPIDDTMGSSCFYDGKFTSAYRNDAFHEPWTSQFILDWAKYQVGDEVYVKENYRLHKGWDKYTPTRAASLKTKPFIFFESDGGIGVDAGRFRSALFMPEKFSRLRIKITDVQIELLQEIDDVDALNEGVHTLDLHWLYKYFPEYAKEHKEWIALRQNTSPYPKPPLGPQLRNRFIALWSEIKGPESWDNNPYVWVYEFEVLTTTGKGANNG